MLVALHAVGVCIFAIIRGYGFQHGLVEATPIAAAALVASWAQFGRKMREGAVVVGLVLSSAMLVHLSGGKIELHFHYFVIVGLLTLYQDWFPFLLAVGFVLFEHAVIGVLDPTAVYDHRAALNNPLKWALVHALFLGAASVASLISWRLNEHQSLHDSLTGLANRLLLTDRINHALGRLDRNRDLVAVLFLDLDDFKAINDGLGHAAGDELLMSVARRIRGSLRMQDTACRLGGDEFAVLLEDIASPNDAVAVAQRVFTAITQPMMIKGREVTIQASMGLAFAIDPTQTADDLLRNSDMAMYAAKHGGKGRFELFEPDMHAAVIERLELESDLRRAVSGNELVLHYQPIVALDTGNLEGVEALLRWQHPRRGLIPPLDFLAIAEETGVIIDIGYWVLEEACRQMRQWQDTTTVLGAARCSVNLSAKQFQDESLVVRVEAALAATGVSADRLVLEITESTLMIDTEVTAQRLQALRALGVKIAIDDFGTGYSSLAYLRRFEIDILKVDRSFVDPLARSDKDSALAEAIVTMAQALQLEVVPEGIERLDQVGLLKQWGCRVGQGFFFARPMTPADLEVSAPHALPFALAPASEFFASRASGAWIPHP